MIYYYHHLLYIKCSRIIEYTGFVEGKLELLKKTKKKLYKRNIKKNKIERG